MLRSTVQLPLGGFMSKSEKLRLPVTEFSTFFLNLRQILF